MQRTGLALFRLKRAASPLTQVRAASTMLLPLHTDRRCRWGAREVAAGILAVCSLQCGNHKPSPQAGTETTCLGLPRK